MGETVKNVQKPRNERNSHFLHGGKAFTGDLVALASIFSFQRLRSCPKYVAMLQNSSQFDKFSVTLTRNKLCRLFFSHASVGHRQN